MERPSAIISLDPMLSRAQALLTQDNTYTNFQAGDIAIPQHHTMTRPNRSLVAKDWL